MNTLPIEIETLSVQIPEQKQQEVMAVINQIFIGTEEWENQINQIEVKGIEDTLSISMADAARLNVKKARLNAEKIFDAKRDEVQNQKAMYDIEDKLWLKAKQVMQIKFKAIEEKAEWKANFIKRHEAQQQELRAQKRIAEVAQYAEINRVSFEFLPDEIYEAFLLGLKQEKEAAQAAEEKRLQELETARIQKEEEDQQREAAMKKRQEEIEITKRELEAEKARVEKQKAIAEAEAAKRKQEIEEQAAKERKAIEEQAEKRRLELEAQREKFFKEQEEEKARMIEVQREGRERELKERQAKEQAAAAEAKAAQELTDQDAVAKWIESFKLPEAPRNTNAVLAILDKYEGFKKWAHYTNQSTK